ncbi:restriction endonuclease [Pontibacter actiniarum]|uniref:Restriction endonuclease type IV Mrr domain-containing protein n=1 Tax=Pontibacter actiniarum TaxID=323450 RepID=A0A1X9YN98_9BACT|nr:restriction endonuclease [Pontibacter actiniarum]ARS34324.1 hypothetical protein CA264_02085 [Pontibacter actiniarum]
MKKSEEFEKLIEKIHRILEPDGSTVTWNERIPDPDNPKQLRQIDILISSKGLKKYIECRIHNKPQDVKWIEYLHGEKASLNLEEIVAVSASGFTEGAIKKAKRFGIELKTLSLLTESEILAWKPKSSCSLVFYKVEELLIKIKPFQFVKDESTKKTMIHNFTTSQYALSNALNSYFHTLMSNNHKVAADGTYNMLIHTYDKLTLAGLQIAEIQINGRIKPFIREVYINTMQEYSSSICGKGEVHIENFEEAIKIIKTDTKNSLVLNFDNVVLPDNVIFSGDLIIGLGKASRMGPVYYESTNDPQPNINVIKYCII